MRFAGPNFSIFNLNFQTFIGYKNPCIEYCENGAICQLDESQIHPMCVCSGEWMGKKCNTPPTCQYFCGDCIHGSSINECL